MAKRELIGVMMAGLVLFWARPAPGAIYYQIDEHGVAHFTNTPTTPEYRLLRPGPLPSSSRLVPASIEQLIAAVDELKGSTDWRKRALEGEDRARKRGYLYDLVNLTLICNEGRAGDLVRAAMAAGAGGATLSKLSHTRTDGAASPVSPAREMSELVIGKGAVEAIVGAMEAEGVFDQETAGFIALKPVSVACSHQSVHH